MSDERHSEVLGGLPRTRPHRRSDKRATNPPPAPAPAAETRAASKPTAATTGSAKTATKTRSAPPAAKAQPKLTAAKAKSKPAASRSKSKPPAASAPKSSAGRLRQPAQPAGSPSRVRAPGAPKPAPRPVRPKPAAPRGGEIVGTAVQAAAELAEIGLSVGARALRRAVSRLPRP